MEKRFTFVARTQLMREPDGSHFYKAGFFYSNATGFLSPIKRRPAFTERLRNASARASGCVRSGIWQVAFLSAYTRTQSNHAYQQNIHPNTGAAKKTKVYTSCKNQPIDGKRSRAAKATVCDARSIFGCNEETRGNGSRARGLAAQINGHLQVTPKHFFTPLAHLDNQARV